MILIMASQRKVKCGYQSPLCWPERYLYFAVTVATIAYIIYCVYRDSVDNNGILSDRDFDQGWWWLGRRKDISNFEWQFWYNMFFSVWPWYLGHVALSRIVEWKLHQFRKPAFLLLSLLSLTQLIGWKPVCLYLGHFAILYIISLTGLSALVWVTSLALLSTLNFEPFIILMKELVDDNPEETWYYLLMFTLALTNIRSTSFCLEKCWAKVADKRLPNDEGTAPSSDHMYQQIAPNARSSPSHHGNRSGSHSTTTSGTQPTSQNREPAYSFLEGLLYIFYLPLFFTGPILTYDKFQVQIDVPLQSNQSGKMFRLCLHLCRFMFWGLFNEFILHFLYFNALQHNMGVLQSVSLFTLCGLGFSHGQFFMVKYLVMFGLPATVARMDHLDPPQGPKCISYIYLYSDMWKYFDRGLYSFLKRYIYVACGGSKSGIHRQILGSLLCFMYIFYWHGAEYSILLWILLNYLGVTLEKVGSLITSITLVKHAETHVLSTGMVKRLHALCSIPIFLVSCFSMFCFFGGHVVGHIFFKRLILEGTTMSFLVLVALLYCAIQNASEVNLWLYGQSKHKPNTA